MTMLPAWSWQFAGGHLASVPRLPLDAPITREWAWGGATGAGVRVAVIDSGVDASHPAVRHVAGAVAVEYDADTGRTRYVEGPHEDLYGHGTACAGLIRRAAPDCEIYSVRVLGATLSGRGAVFGAGLEWAIDNGMHVANLSLSSRRTAHFAMFHQLADRAYFSGLVLVSAVNNVPAPSYPSQFAAVLSVAARPGDDPFDFDYNPNPPVEFGAPGVDIEVPWSNGGTIRATGNSFACPHITGLVARLLSKHPGLTPFQVKTVLHSLASNAVP